METAYRDLSDDALAQRLAAGEERAFAELYGRYWPPLFLMAERLLRDSEDARDVLQEAFIALWDRRAGLGGVKSVSGYLYRMMRNGVIDRIAEGRKRTDLLAGLAHWAEATTPTLDAAVYERELQQLVSDEVAHMPERMRQVYELSRNEDLSHQEIARRLSITPSTVKSHINGALHRIRKRMEAIFSLLLV